MILYAISYAHPVHGTRYLSMTGDPVQFPRWTNDTPRLYMTEGGAKLALRCLPEVVSRDCWVTKMIVQEYEEGGQ